MFSFFFVPNLGAMAVLLVLYCEFFCGALMLSQTKSSTHIYIACCFEYLEFFDGELPKDYIYLL